MIQAIIKFPKSYKPYDYKSNLGKWLNKDIEFSKISGAEFTKEMVLGTVEFDEDNTIYVLIPKEVFEKHPIIKLSQLKGKE